MEDWEGPPVLLQYAEGESRVVPEGHAHHLECHGLEVLCHLGLKGKELLDAHVQQVGEGVIQSL